MKKFAILAVNNNPDFFYYLPLTKWTWEKIGWEIKVLYQRDDTIPTQTKELEQLMIDTIGINFIPHVIQPIPGYRSDTITQISRLYAALLPEINPEDYIMTIDADMLALSDAWQFDPDDITLWNHDLTGYSEIPMCYCGMRKMRWIEVIGCTGTIQDRIKYDLDQMPNAKESAPWEQRWSVDQQLLTKRIRDTQFKKTFIPRGQYSNGYAAYRIDRGDWRLDHDQFIDAHLLRDCYKKSDLGIANFAKVMTLLYKIWPNENFDWMVTYTKEFQRLANNG